VTEPGSSVHGVHMEPTALTGPLHGPAATPKALRPLVITLVLGLVLSACVVWQVAGEAQSGPTPRSPIAFSRR
jgi:hypothetical protein